MTVRNARPKNEVVLRIVMICFFWSLSLLQAAQTGLAVPTASVPVSSPLCDVPVEVHNGHVYVPVQIDSGAKLVFLLDSGAAAPVNILDGTKADELGISVKGSAKADAIGGALQVRFTDPLHLSVGGFRLPTQKLAVMDISGGAREEKHSVDGLLGYELFRRYVVQIDYPAKRLRLYARLTKDSAKDSITVPLRVLGKSCVVDARLKLGTQDKAIPVSLIVDTGYDGTVILCRPFVLKHKLVAGKANAGAGLGGTTSSRDVHLSTIRLGALRILDVHARGSLDRTGPFSSSSVDGFIGGGVLQDFVVTFDYEGGRLLLRR